MGRVVIITKLVLLVIAAMLLGVTIAAQTKSAGERRHHVYSPAGASFTIRVPGPPLPTESSVFDGDNEWAFRLIEGGQRSKTYNFEVKTASNKHSILVSILEAQTAKSRAHRFITDAEIKAINDVIADSIVSSKVLRQATEDGEISQWSFQIKAGLGDDDEDDGLVYVRRWHSYMVVVVIKYRGVVSSSDATTIKTMLDSLRPAYGVLKTGRAFDPQWAKTA